MTDTIATHRALVDRLRNIAIENGLTCERHVIVGQTPFREPFAVDLVLHRVPGYPTGLAVLGRTQGRSGSAEQKLPYLVLAIRRARRPCIVVLDGEGWGDGAVAWMLGQARDEIVGVMTVAEFEAFLARACGLAEDNIA